MIEIALTRKLFPAPMTFRTFFTGRSMCHSVLLEIASAKKTFSTISTLKVSLPRMSQHMPVEMASVYASFPTLLTYKPPFTGMDFHMIDKDALLIEQSPTNPTFKVFFIGMDVNVSVKNVLSRESFFTATAHPTLLRQMTPHVPGNVGLKGK